ncbi:MAG: ABC transporter ATP-binding protein [Promethearchaeota archaeon]
MSIEGKNVDFSYDLEKILENFSIQFNKGHFYGILGPNGCGKTTLLNLLSGLLKIQYKHGDTGEIVIDDSDIRTWSPRKTAKALAYVQQSRNGMNFDFTVKEIVLMGRYAYIDRFSNESEEDIQVVDDILTDLNLIHLTGRLYSELSGGEQQKVIIARAIAQQAKILLLDEPTSHLDINFQIEFMELFQTFVKRGILVIAVLHDLNLAAQFCDKILLLKDRGIHAFGTVEETITQENIFQVYNISVVVKKNPVTNSIFITPIRNYLVGQQKLNGVKPKIHLIAGGGNAISILPELRGFDVSVGVVNVLDNDHSLASDLGYKIISEAPFSPISEGSAETLQVRLNSVELVLLANIPFGNANLKNLEILFSFSGTILVIEDTPIETRDFTDGRATEFYKQICSRDSTHIIQSTDDVREKLHDFLIQ